MRDTNKTVSLKSLEWVCDIIIYVDDAYYLTRQLSISLDIIESDQGKFRLT